VLRRIQLPQLGLPSLPHFLFDAGLIRTVAPRIGIWL
jgi:hypothetical protein